MEERRNRGRDRHGKDITGNIIWRDKLTNVNGTLYFEGYDDIHGFELWKSDGTEAGTVMVKEIQPGYTEITATALQSDQRERHAVLRGE